MKKMYKFSMLGVALLVVLTIGAGGGTSEAFNPGTPREPQGGPSRITVGGHAAPVVSLSVLAEHSDIVARVTPRSIIEDAWSYPGSRVNPHLAATRRVDIIELEVLESLRGLAPEAITVFLPRPGGTIRISGDDLLELMTFQEGKEYVLFLVSTDGSEYWPEGGYLIQGVWQGHWEVDGSVATRAHPRKTLSVDQIRLSVK